MRTITCTQARRALKSVLDAVCAYAGVTVIRRRSGADAVA